MDTFVKRFQPDRYDKWMNGLDIGPHPEDIDRAAVTTSQAAKNKRYFMSKTTFC